jgi:thiol-disulfide isomerase/thioredoxin
MKAVRSCHVGLGSRERYSTCSEQHCGYHGAVTIVAVVIAMVPPPCASHRSIVGSASPFRVGDSVGLVPATFEGSDLTVLLFARSTCSVCAEATPYLNLLARELTKDGRVRFLFVPTHGVSAPELAYGALLGVSQLEILDAPWTVRARIESVPTLVVVDRTGRIRAVRSEGRRSPQYAIDLAATMRASLPQR